MSEFIAFALDAMDLVDLFFDILVVGEELDSVRAPAMRLSDIAENMAKKLLSLGMRPNIWER